MSASAQTTESWPCSCWAEWLTDNFHTCANCMERCALARQAALYEPRRPRSWFMPHAKKLAGPTPERHWPETDMGAPQGDAAVSALRSATAKLRRSLPRHQRSAR